MTVVVSGILSIALKQYKNNNEVQENLNLQEKDFAEDNSDVEETEKIDEITMNFGGTTIKVDDVSSMASKNQSGMQLNKLNVTIEKENDNGGGGGSNPVPDDIKTTEPHLYGTKALKDIFIQSEVDTPADGGDYTVKMHITIHDSDDGFFMKSRANSIKVVLPKGAYDSTQEINGSVFSWDWGNNPRWDYTNEDYTESDIDKDNTNIRLSMCANKMITITFKISKVDYDANFGSVWKYFVDKDGADANTATLTDKRKTTNEDGTFEYVYTGYYAYSKI